jgi:ankyrin repeat protein
MTPLMYATDMKVEVIKALLDHGADVDIKNEKGSQDHTLMSPTQ